MSEFNFELPESLHVSLKHLSIDTKKTMEQIVVEAIDEKIKKERLKGYKKK